MQSNSRTPIIVTTERIADYIRPACAPFGGTQVRL
jgi:hypothetical protein